MTDYQKAVDLESDEKSIESIKTKLKRVSNMISVSLFMIKILTINYF